MEPTETKYKVLTAAAELISIQGYHNVSVREICEAAGVTKPVLYYYFKDKEDVLSELIKEGNLRFKELLDINVKPEKSLEKKLHGLFKAYLKYTEIYPHLIRISIIVQLSPLPEKIKSLSTKKSNEIIEYVSALFVQGKKEKLFPEDADLEMLTYSLMAPFGVIIAQSVLFKNNVKPLKDNLKKYFEFWKSHFLSKGK